MAWVSLGSADLVDGSTVRGYAYFEYDNSSTGTNRSCRIRIGARSGYSFNVIFRDITVAGTNYGTVSGVTQNSGTIWSGSIAGGRNVTATWTNPWYAGTKYPSITGYLPVGGTAPSGVSVTYNSATWDSVNLTGGVTSWGTGYSSTPNLDMIIVDSSATSDNWQNKGRQIKTISTTETSVTQSISNSNSTATSGGLAIKGMTPFKIAAKATTTISSTAIFRTSTYYTPPAPGQFSYTDPGGSGTKIFPIEFTGVVANNYASYTAADLTRTVRYSIDGGAWVYEVNNVVTALDAVTSFSISVPAGSTAVIEGWMEYKGGVGETATISLLNSNNPTILYGSVNTQARAITKLYGSVNGQTKEIKKLYASVGGVTKKIFEAS